MWPNCSTARSPVRRLRSAGLDKLAGIGELDPLARARLLLAQVQVDLRRIWRLVDGDRHPDPGPVQALLEADAREPAARVPTRPRSGGHLLRLRSGVK